MNFNVAIDGPAGAGKSTIAKAVARKLNMIYVDTGAMYRAMALHVLRSGAEPGDKAAVIGCCETAVITIRYVEGEQAVYLNGLDVTPYLRTEDVSRATSVISAIPQVREKMVQLQKELAASSDCIMDGRDIGTCVLPKAQLKIYLTADSSVRAKRRYDELTAKGERCDLDEIRRDIEERDDRDMHREVSPLRRAEDAVLVDTSDMSVEEVIRKIMELCLERREA